MLGRVDVTDARVFAFANQKLPLMVNLYLVRQSPYLIIAHAEVDIGDRKIPLVQFRGSASCRRWWQVVLEAPSLVGGARIARPRDTSPFPSWK